MTASNADPVRPERLLRNGRPEFNQFEAAEDLYRRCDPEHIAPDGRVLGEAFRFPELSMSRSRGPSDDDRFEPEDALWIPSEYADEGQPEFLRNSCVVQFTVADVPSEIEREGVAPYTTQIQHAPYEDLYPHSIVNVLRDGGVVPNRESAIKPAARRELRDRMASRSTVVYRPQT